jgi:hypothetical protein
VNPSREILAAVGSPAVDRDVEQHVLAGSELLKHGNLADAQAAFRSALELDRDNARVLALLGLTYFRGGQFSEARPIYEALVERAPTDASHRLNLGLVYLKVGDSDRAIEALEASRALDPSQGRTVSYLGLAYARAGRYAEAYRSFLLAGQHELASEIEVNLTPAERDSILKQLDRANAEPRARPPTQPRRAPTAPEERLQVSMPEILIDRPVAPEPPPVTPAPEPALLATPGPPPSYPDPVAPPMSESQQFVLATAEPVPAPVSGQTMVSRAVEIASLSAAAAAAGAARVGWGSTPPIPLSQLATEHLVRPDDTDQPFEVTASGSLVIRVTERVLTRLDGVHVTGGELEFEPATRRSRGHQTEDSFEFGGSRLHVVSGTGYLIAVPGDHQFTPVALDDDILYLREDFVFAFEATLRWENGHVPGLRGKLPVVQFRGDGAVTLRAAQPLVRVKLPAQGVMMVGAHRLAGWIGRVVPRAVVPPSDGPLGEVCVECTGEGIVLVDPSPGAAEISARLRRPTAPPPGVTLPGPPPPPPPGARDGVEELAAELRLDDEI